MRWIAFFLRIVLFLVVLVFALANTHPVVVTLIPGVAGLSFEAPMVVWLLTMFTAGVLACFIALLPTLVSNWRRARSMSQSADRA